MALKNKEYQALCDRVTALVKDGMKKEEMNEILSITKSIEQLDVDYSKQCDSYRDLQKDYINAFRSAPVSNKDESDIKPRTLEEIANEILNKGKKE